MEYLVKEKQYEKLQKQLDDFATFRYRLVDAISLYLDTARELGYLVEDIGKQEIEEK